MKITYFLRAFAPLLLVAAFVLCPALLFSQQQETVLRARIWLDGKSMAELDAAGLEADHGFYTPGQSFESEFSASELLRAHKAGFRIDTICADVLANYLRENARQKPRRTVALRSANPCDGLSGPSPATPVNYTYGTMGGYYKYEEFLAVLDDMRAKFPHLISVRQVLHPTLLTHEGRPLWYVRLSDHPDSDEPEPEALYTALHHAREPNSLTHLIYFMWHLLENYSRDAEIQYLVDNTELYFVPCLNPDGYIYNQTTSPDGGGFWRKNRRENGDGSFGVDLNRNYAYQWGDLGGSSGEPFSDTYRGPAPFSEPETQMIQAFAESHDFGIALNCHTSGNKLVHPWTYTNLVADPGFGTLGEWFTKDNFYFPGTCFQTLGYLANGSSDDWWVAEKGVYAFTPETGGSFWPTVDQIDFNNKGMLGTNLSAAWYALGGAVIRHLPGEEFEGNKLNVPFKIKQYELGTNLTKVSFEVLSANIQSISPAPTNISITDFGTSEITAQVTLKPGIQQAEIIRFVGKALQNGQVHTDTFEIKYSPSPYTKLFEDTVEDVNAGWTLGAWSPSAEISYSPLWSMTDSPNTYYSAEENTLTTALPLYIPADATDARLRFYAYWDIEPEYDWAQVLVSTDGGNAFIPIEGALTKPSIVLGEPVYEGAHTYWESECMDFSPFIGQPILLRFAMTSFSGNHFLRDGFYFDDLVLEYKAGEVRTLDIPNAWSVESRPNPASAFTRFTWQSAGAPYPAVLEVRDAGGRVFAQESLENTEDASLKMPTAGWPTGIYFYRITTARGNSSWRKLVIAR